MTSRATGAPRPRVFVNAGNVTASGPAALVRDLLPAVLGMLAESGWTATVYAPPALLGAAEGADRPVGLRCITAPVLRGARNDVARALDLHGGLRRLVRRERASVCLSLGDLGPGRLGVPQVLFVHNALHALWPAEEGVIPRPWRGPKRWYLERMMRRGLRSADRVVVQSPVMADRLVARHGIPREVVRCVAQPAPTHAARATRDGAPVAPPRRDDGDRTTWTLLFLAAYYPHKHHAVLAPLAEELRRRGLAGRVRIHVTVPDATWASPEFRAVREGAEGVVDNLGRLDGAAVAAALADADALFLPTLVESYGLTYVEAMRAGLPILTSDRDFARWMCAGAATYFDPFDVRTIADAIAALPAMAADPAVAAARAARLAALPATWRDASLGFVRAIAEVCAVAPPAAALAPLPSGPSRSQA